HQPEPEATPEQVAHQPEPEATPEQVAHQPEPEATPEQVTHQPEPEATSEQVAHQPEPEIVEAYPGEVVERATQWLQWCGAQREQGVMMYHTDGDRTYLRVESLADNLMVELDRLVSWLAKAGMIQSLPGDHAETVPGSHHLVVLAMDGWQGRFSLLSQKGYDTMLQALAERAGDRPAPRAKPKAQGKIRRPRDNKVARALCFDEDDIVELDPPAITMPYDWQVPAEEPGKMSEEDNQQTEGVQHDMNQAAMNAAVGGGVNRLAELQNLLAMMELHHGKRRKYLAARIKLEGFIGLEVDYFDKETRGAIEFPLGEIAEFKQQIEGRWYYVIPTT
uniref:hypothetical protein n=1 Tax=Aeromonas veronii TaxID=654 RepID=UPI003D25E9EC